jgi:hypothetical protein
MHSTAISRFLRPQFSLRILLLFIVAAAIYLGIQTNWVRNRREAREWLRKHDGSIWIMGDRDVPAPWGLGIFGEYGCTDIVITDSAIQDDPRFRPERLKKMLFPESAVSIYNSKTNKWTPVP